MHVYYSTCVLKLWEPYACYIKFLILSVWIVFYITYQIYVFTLFVKNFEE